MQEAERPELSIAGCTRAHAAQGGADGSDEDPQNGAGDVRVVVQEGTQSLRQAQHPLADGKVGQHVIRDVGGDLGHAPCIARGTDAAALTGEREKPFVATVLTP